MSRVTNERSKARIEAVQISCGGQGAYRQEALALAELYGELLGMERYEPGYVKIAKPDGSLPEIGFEGDDDPPEPRPRWPDPERPQQAHLDIEVGDLDAAEATALRLGATKLHEASGHRVYADSVGHPFCLYPDAYRQPACPAASRASSSIASVLEHSRASTKSCWTCRTGSKTQPTES